MQVRLQHPHSIPHRIMSPSRLGGLSTLLAFLLVGARLQLRAPVSSALSGHEDHSGNGISVGPAASHDLRRAKAEPVASSGVGHHVINVGGTACDASLEDGSYIKLASGDHDSDAPCAVCDQNQEQSRRITSPGRKLKLCKMLAAGTVAFLGTGIACCVFGGSSGTIDPSEPVERLHDVSILIPPLGRTAFLPHKQNARDSDKDELLINPGQKSYVVRNINMLSAVLWKERNSL